MYGLHCWPWWTGKAPQAPSWTYAKPHASPARWQSVWPAEPRGKRPSRWSMTGPPTALLSLVSTRTCPLLGCTPKGRAECCPTGCSQWSSPPLPSQLDSSCRNGFSTNKYNIIIKENAQVRREGGLKGEDKLPRTSQRLGRGRLRRRSKI